MKKQFSNQTTAIVQDFVMHNTTLSSFAGDDAFIASNCSSTTNVDLSTVDVDFKALQYSMLITIVVEVLGALFFFATAWYFNIYILGL